MKPAVVSFAAIGLLAVLLGLASADHQKRSTKPVSVNNPVHTVDNPTPSIAPPVSSPAPKKLAVKPKKASVVALVHSNAVTPVLVPPVYTMDNPPPGGWDATNAPGFGITCGATTQCLNEAFGGTQEVDAPAKDDETKKFYGPCNAVPEPLSPDCWNVIVEPSATVPGSFDYSCEYMGLDGGVVRVFRMTAETDNQGLTCKP